MPRLNIPDLADGLSDSLGDELNSRKDSLQAVCNSALCFRGAWSAALDVKQNDLVRNAGHAWIALQDSVNVTPAEGAFWTQLV